jgi:hypothetical protein
MQPCPPARDKGWAGLLLVVLLCMNMQRGRVMARVVAYAVWGRRPVQLGGQVPASGSVTGTLDQLCTCRTWPGGGLVARSARFRFEPCSKQSTRTLKPLARTVFTRETLLKLSVEIMDRRLRRRQPAS